MVGKEIVGDIGCFGKYLSRREAEVELVGEEMEGECITA
jgi:hypothetical protein